MKDILNLVKGAVSTRDLVPVLTHFLIYGDGRIQGGNGRVSIDAECAALEGLNFAVPAERFIKAVDACNSDPVLSLRGDKLSVATRGFKALLPVLPAESYPYRPLIKDQPCLYSKGNPPFLGVLRKLRPFISTDASRPWSNSVLFSGGYAYATNNVVLARCPCHYSMPSEQAPDMQISTAGVDEILRIGQEVDSFSQYSNALHFNYVGFWLEVQAVETLWPSKLGEICRQLDDREWTQAGRGLADAVRKLAPFFPDKKVPVVLLEGGTASTLAGDSSAEVELGVELGERSMFSLKPLLAVLEVASVVDFGLSQNTAAWAGDGIDGLISKMRA